MVEKLSVGEFIARLRDFDVPRRDGADVIEFLDRHAPSASSLAPWVAFDPARYARRRLYRDESFELLLLCWDRGQATPVHDHDGQRCWMKIVKGELHIEELEREEPVADGLARETGTALLHPAREFTAGAGRTVAEAEGEERIHRVAANSRRSLSLHLYSRPLDSFLVFDPQRSTYQRVRP